MILLTGLNRKTNGVTILEFTTRSLQGNNNHVFYVFEENKQ